MNHQELDNELLLRCFLLWKRDIGRAGQRRRAITFVVSLCACVLTMLVGVSAVKKKILGPGAAVLCLALLLVMLFELMPGCNLVRRRSDWPSEDQKAVISKFIFSLKSEAELEAADIPILLALADNRISLMNEKVHGSWSLLIGVVATGLFGAICSAGVDHGAPIEGVSLQGIVGLILLLGLNAVTLVLLLAKFIEYFFDEYIPMSRSDFRSFEEALLLASLKQFEECWHVDRGAGKHMRRT